jgi:DNA-binding PadR family transcriptional regulator
VRFVILGLLLGGPLSLYDVRKRFSAGISLFYSASFGGIQRALQQLLESGSITVADSPDDPRGKKLYSVTSLGRTRWRQWMLDEIPPGADAETLMLAKIYLVGRIDDPADRRAVLARARARAVAALDDLRHIATEVDMASVDLPEDVRTIAAFQRATLDYGLRAHVLAVTWVDELIRREDAP